MERRVNPRWSLNSSNLVISNISKESQHSGLITDISVGGMGILTTAIFSAGENIVLSAQLSPAKPPLKTKATVRWSQVLDQNTKYGIEFAEINIDIVREYIQDIHISNIESFLGCSLPESIKSVYINDWISKTYDEVGIPKIIAFEKPFLKIDKIIVFDSFEKGQVVQKKSISVGKLYEKDVQGHYYNTIFLAICGQLMGQAASILVAALNHGTAPQIIEVENVKPSMIKDQAIWKLRKSGSPFFVEIEIKRKRLSLFVVDTRISFGDIVMGMTKEMKLFLTPKESILEAETLPSWT